MAAKRSGVGVGVAVLAAGVGVGVVGARAQDMTVDPPVRASVGVTPSRAGTADRPEGVALRVAAQLGPAGGPGARMVTGVELWTGPGLDFGRGRGYAECSVATLRRLGPAGCPPESIVGAPAGEATVEPPDDMSPLPKITFVNGPGRRPLAFVVLTTPARVSATIVPEVVRGARGAWPHRLRWTFPAELRTVVGIRISLRGFRFTLGGKRYARHYLATTGCPQRGWAWRLRVHTDGAGVLAAQGHVACRRAAAG